MFSIYAIFTDMMKIFCIFAALGEPMNDNSEVIEINETT